MSATPTYSRAKELAQEGWLSTAVGRGGLEKFSEAYRNPFRYFIGAENQE
jgi:hypothetical protein